MTLTLELTPEQEKALRKEAARRGLPIADYVAALLDRHAPGVRAATAAADPQDRAGAFREWAAGHNVNNPLLAEEASRPPERS